MAIPINCVLYTHYGYLEDKDFKAWKDDKDISKLQGVQYLVNHLKSLHGLLTFPGHESLLVLFYAPGFADCLEGIANGKTDKEVLMMDCEELQFAEAVDGYIQNLLRTDEELLNYQDLALRLRFVTPLDLLEVFGQMKNWNLIQNLRTWFMGPTARLRYDSPKMIEAIMRLRLIGAGVPVFRVDFDVLMRGDENWMLKNLEFSSTVASCLKAFEKRRDSPNLSSFIFSASYDYKPLHNAELANDFYIWSRAFATRVFPALPVKTGLIEEALKSMENGLAEELAWDRYASKSFNQSLTRKFYGLDQKGISTSFVKGIGKIGAHPLAAVISGAMLYLSDGAILDLPPFSNFRLNVMWIDDHLKYCLHRELRHLTPGSLKDVNPPPQADPLLSHSRLDEVLVKKARGNITNLIEYTFGNYLPTLLWGTIMDSWITSDARLKYRPESLSDKDREELKSLPRRGKSAAPLTAALQTALEQGGFESSAEAALEEKLLEVALKRINEVRRQWIELSEDGLETFASMWAKGIVKNYFPNLPRICFGIAADDVRIEDDIPSVTSLNPLIFSDLRNLVRDAMQYINFALNWPRIIQVIRSIEQGTLRTDLNYVQKPEPAPEN